MPPSCMAFPKDAFSNLEHSLTLSIYSHVCQNHVFTKSTVNTLISQYRPCTTFHTHALFHGHMKCHLQSKRPSFFDYPSHAPPAALSQGYITLTSHTITTCNISLSSIHAPGSYMTRIASMSFTHSHGHVHVFSAHCVPSLHQPQWGEAAAARRSHKQTQYSAKRS